MFTGAYRMSPVRGRLSGTCYPILFPEGPV